MHGRRSLAVLFLVMAVSLAALVSMASAEQPIIASGCSVSNIGYLNDLAKEYERRSPGVHILVRGGGSLLGLTELRGDKTDFAASCKGKGASDQASFEFVTVAWDALVFIVNKSNPVSSITAEQVRDIYDGRITNWKALGGPDLGIKSYVSTPEGMGGIGEALAKYILGGRQISNQPNSVVMASSVAVWEQMVEKIPEGFASTGFASARKRDVKMLNLNGVPPTKANIISGKYPFRRRLYLVYDKKEVRPEVRKFIDFALGREGQKFISMQGIPSLSEIK